MPQSALYETLAEKLITNKYDLVPRWPAHAGECDQDSDSGRVAEAGTHLTVTSKKIVEQRKCIQCCLTRKMSCVKGQGVEDFLFDLS